MACYCSSSCKKEAWDKYHDIECSLYPNLLSKKCNLNNLFTLRLFIIMLKEKNVEKIIEEASKDSACYKPPTGNEIFINLLFYF